MVEKSVPEVRVWDPFVRFGHWALVAAFAVAWLSGDEVMAVHVWAGYLIALWLPLRFVWGFIGPRHARFADFVRPPAEALAYLRDLALFRAPRRLGHSPAGGAMVLALMLCLAATAGTGLLVWGLEGNGPLAGLAAGPAVAGEEGDNDDGESALGGFIEEAHELLADLTLLLAALHVGGVALASLAHRENLPRAMWTGRKRA